MALTERIYLCKTCNSYFALDYEKNKNENLEFKCNTCNTELKIDNNEANYEVTDFYIGETILSGILKKYRILSIKNNLVIAERLSEQDDSDLKDNLIFSCELLLNNNFSNTLGNEEHKYLKTYYEGNEKRVIFTYYDQNNSIMYSLLVYTKDIELPNGQILRVFDNEKEQLIFSGVSINYMYRTKMHQELFICSNTDGFIIVLNKKGENVYDDKIFISFEEEINTDGFFRGINLKTNEGTITVLND